VLCGLGGLLAAPAPAASSWLAPTGISAAGQDAEMAQVALDPAGDATVVWRRFDGSRYAIQAASRGAGGVWDAPVTISAPGQNADAPQIAVDAAGDATAVWSRFDGAETGTNSIVQAASRPAGGVWGPAVDLSAAGRNSERPQIALDAAGDATAVWRRYDGFDFIAETSSRPAGGAWSVPEPLSAPGESAEALELAGNAAGDAAAVWRRRSGADFVVECASRPAGGSWEAATGVSSSGEDADNPQVALDAAGGLTAVWLHHAATYIAESASRPVGGSWGAPVELSDPGKSAQALQLAVGLGGEAIAIWTRPTGQAIIVQAAGRPAGGPWEAPLDLTSTAEGIVKAATPQAAIGPQGEAVAIWTSTEGSPAVVLSSSRPAAGAWSPPEALSETGSGTIDPRVALDPAGDGIAIWSRHDKNSQYVVEAAGLDRAGPQLRLLSIPPAATIRQPASFSVAPFDVWSSIGRVGWSFADGSGAPGTAVSHTFTALGAEAVTVTGEDALGHRTTAAGTVTVYPGARAGHNAFVRNGSALLRIRCASPAGCAGRARLMATAAKRRGGHRGGGRVQVGAAGFNLAGIESTTVAVALTKTGMGLVRRAGRIGLKAQLTGPGVKHRVVVLFGR
jgi:hypothetical protein